MTPRERIQAALNHKQPDRVPVDFGSTPVSGIAAGTVYRLRQALGLDSPGDRVKVTEPYQMLGEVKEDLLQWFHADVIGITGKMNRIGIPNADWKEWRTFDDAKVLVPGLFNTDPEKNGDILQYPEGDKSVAPGLRMPNGGFYHDAIIRQKPIDDNNLNPEDNLEDFPIVSDESLDDQRKEVEFLYENTNYAIAYVMPGGSLGNVAAVPAPWIKDPKGIRDIEEWYISHALRRDYINEVYDRQVDIGLKNLEKILQAFGNKIDIIYVTGTDFGYQRGPLMSPDVFCDLYKPHYKRVCDFIHANTSWKTFIHTCGGVRPLIEHIIEAGFDILNPVQTTAEGMDPRELKKEFGDRVIFHGGGVNTQHTLPHGTPEEVYEEVSDRISILNKGGGYIFNTIHNIQADAPVENIKAMVKAIEDSF
ncbi:MAG: methyltransferase [Candidatus Latescibacteria bacterium]|nr:methyltransferase [Candidatus Latescibacterota bacterium]